MSNPTVTIDYDDIEVNDLLIGTLQHCNCCGLRELSNFQEANTIDDDFYDEVWDWFEDLDDEHRAEYNLRPESRGWGLVDPPFNRIRDKFLELHPEHTSDAPQQLNSLCYMLSTIGKTWTPPTAITILTLVENWDNSYPIMDALVEGGWQLSVDTALNTNSGNDISLWTYRREETV